MNLPSIDRERALRGWTKADLARAMMTTPQFVSRLYRLGRISPEMLARLNLTFQAHPPRPGMARLLKRAS